MAGFATHTLQLRHAFAAAEKLLIEVVMLYNH